MVIKKILIVFSLGLLLFSLIGCNNRDVSSSFTNLTTDKIEKVDVSSPNSQWTKQLTGDEVASLVKLLNRVQTNDIEEYNGPTIKGGPTSITISLKSNQTLVLTLNGDSFIYSEKKKPIK